MAAQVAHAAVAAMLNADPDVVESWLDDGMAKIVLQVSSEMELLTLYKRIEAERLPVEAIRDAGRTVVSAGTLTCIGIGPAPVNKIDALTGQLKLLG